MRFGGGFGALGLGSGNFMGPNENPDDPGVDRTGCAPRDSSARIMCGGRVNTGAVVGRRHASQSMVPPYSFRYDLGNREPMGSSAGFPLNAYARRRSEYSFALCTR